MARGPGSAAWAAGLGAASVELTPAQVSANLSPLQRWAAASLSHGARRLVGVTHLPGSDFQDTVDAVRLLRRQVDVSVVPTVAARNFRDLSHLQDGLLRVAEELQSQPERRVLLVGGGHANPRGTVHRSSQVLESSVIAKCGFSHVGLPVFPEAPDRIRFLRSNLDVAVDQGLGTFLVSQFVLRKESSEKWLASLDERIAEQPLWYGLLGPATNAAHHRFAERCGVLTRRPDAMLDELEDRAAYDDQVELVGQTAASRNGTTTLHVYPVGCVQDSLDWTQH